MGFFGELKQDLSQVAGEEKKKEEKAAEADKILTEAEVAGMDEAEKVLDSMSEASDDDVSALLKDLVSDLGSDVEIPEETASDVSDDLNDILEGLMTEDLTAEAEPAPAAEPENEAQQMEIADLLSGAEEAASVAEVPVEEAVAPVIEEPAAEAVIEEPAVEAPVIEEPAPEPAVEEAAAEEPAAVDYSSAVDEVFASIDEEAVAQAKEIAEPEPAAEPEPKADEAVYEELKADLENNDYKGAEKMETGSYSDETSVITGGMIVNGDVESEGSLDVVGKVNGDVSIKGKLNVTGHIIGNSEAKEVFAENAKITGNVTSESSVKIGAGTVIVGNISAFSAAIAGAVKGDIDVHGPVILDSTAIVMGNIRSKSVQINNGAALEGVCSQAYAEVSPTAFFDDYKPETKPERKAAKKKEEA